MANFRKFCRHLVLPILLANIASKHKKYHYRLFNVYKICKLNELFADRLLK